jgi:hypothetical protein
MIKTNFKHLNKTLVIPVGNICLPFFIQAVSSLSKLNKEPVAQIGFCHPELVSGSHNPLIL